MRRVSFPLRDEMLERFDLSGMKDCADEPVVYLKNGTFDFDEAVVNDYIDKMELTEEVKKQYLSGVDVPKEKGARYAYGWQKGYVAGYKIGYFLAHFEITVNLITQGVKRDQIKELMALSDETFDRIRQFVEEIKQQRLQKLCLGTVQFGLDYGIANKKGKPSLEDSVQMLNHAYDSGIRWFDTAQAYGNAEEILGEFIARRNDLKELRVISKLLPHAFDKGEKPVFEDVQEAVHSSLKRLHLNSLEGFLFHTPEYIYRDDVIEQMIKVREKGLVKNIGVSIYEVKHAVDAAKMDWVDYIQIPHSVFDQRVANSDFFDVANKNGKTVFARSAFLQGLSLMDPEDVPEKLDYAKGYLKKLIQLSENYGYSRLEISELFTLQDDEIDFLVFGVDNLQQLKDDIELNNGHSLPNDLVESLKKEFKAVKKSVVMPSLWKTKKPDFKIE